MCLRAWSYWEMHLEGWKCCTVPGYRNKHRWIIKLAIFILRPLSKLWYLLVMHWEEILQIMWLADVEIHTKANINNQSDAYNYLPKFHLYLTKLSYLNTVLVLFLIYIVYNIFIRVCKIDWPINWLINTDSGTGR